MAKVKEKTEEVSTKKIDFSKMSINIDEILHKKRKIIPISPKLDIGLNGGIPEGVWGIVSGAPKLGKTSLALTMAANAQKPENGGKKVYYIDVETRLSEKNLLGIHGLDLSPEKFEIIRSTHGNIYSGEEFLGKIEDLLKKERNIFVILDSSSSLCSKAEQESEITSQFRNPGAKLMATLSRKIAPIVPTGNSILLVIQHLIANTSGWGSPFNEDGGTKVVYQSDFKLRGLKFNDWKDGEKQIGQIIKWDIVFSALGAPGASVESYLRYGYGIDDILENIELGIDFGIISKGGAWFTLSYLEEEVKLQGQHRVRDHMIQNKEDYILLQKKIKEVIS